MKRLAILSMTFLLVMAVAQVQAQESKKEAKKEAKKEIKAIRKLEAKSVSTISKNSFYADFGDVPGVKWVQSKYFDEARFTKDGKELTAFYDFDGKLVGTTSVKTFADLLPKGQAAIQNKYKDYSIGPVVFFDDNEFNESDMLLYGIQFQDEDNYFGELTKGNKKMIVRVDPRGLVEFFKEL
jgi:hypothetical protein